MVHDWALTRMLAVRILDFYPRALFLSDHPGIWNLELDVNRRLSYGIRWRLSPIHLVPYS